MTVTHLLTDTGNAALWLSGAAIIIFVVQYTLLARWWTTAIGISIVGLALVDLAIYIPPLMALADPHDFANFAATRWYLFLTVGIVVASAGFLVTRIVTWERIRRRRKHGGELALPAHMADRIRELEAQLAECQQRAGETP